MTLGKVIGIGVISALALFSFHAITSADETIISSDFESGMSPWGASGASISNCSTGSSGVKIQTAGLIQAQIDGPRAAGTFTVHGYAEKQTGTPTIAVAVRWFDSAGAQVGEDLQSFTPSASYTAFSRTLSAQAASSYLVRIAVSGPGASVCLDDIAVSGPPKVAPTSTPTATATSTPTSTPATPTSTAVATSTATKTPAPTGTTGATQTPASASAGVTGAGGSLVNGGFEDGTAGWQKIGGELSAVGDPVNSGKRAGALTSATSSTKWAYQVVTIDPNSMYELSGYVRADAGAASAYLRISWYASADGSGSQLSTIDSTGSAGAGIAWTLLTTGAVQPPSDARSARLRAMLDPASALPATLYLDDFSFNFATIESEAATSNTAGAADAASAPRSAAPQQAASGSDAKPASSGRTSQVNVIEAAEDDAASRPGPTAHIGDADWAATYVWLAAPLVLVLALSGAVLYSRRHVEP